jgi:hypothetical protein
MEICVGADPVLCSPPNENRVGWGSLRIAAGHYLPATIKAARVDRNVNGCRDLAKCNSVSVLRAGGPTQARFWLEWGSILDSAMLAA